MRLFSGILLLAATQALAQSAERSYTAVISCGLNGQNINVLACFEHTDLKLTRERRAKIYRAHQLQYLGVMYGDGLHIDLPETFAIRAQNSHEDFILGVQIIDGTGSVIIEDQAGSWGTVLVRN